VRVIQLARGYPVTGKNLSDQIRFVHPVRSCWEDRCGVHESSNC
jgi:hypothetical protein